MHRDVYASLSFLLFFGYFRLPLHWVLRPIPLIDDAITVDQCSHHSARSPFISYFFLLSITVPYAVHFIFPRTSR